MLDRLISGAGAVTDAADRAVRLLVGGWRGGFAMTRPGSIVVAGLLLVLAGILVAAGLEVTAPTTPVPLDPAGVATARDLGDRTYSTMTGSLSTTWIETYDDANANGIEDGDETGDAWFYWLVDPVGRRGVTVRSERSPAEIFTYRGRGIVIADPKDRTEEYGLFDDEIAASGHHRGSRGGARYDDRRRGARPGGAGRAVPGVRDRRRAERCADRQLPRGVQRRLGSERPLRRRRPGPLRDRGLRPGDPARHPGARAAAAGIQRRDRDRAPATRRAGGGRRADEPGFRFHGARSRRSRTATCSTRSCRRAARRWRTSSPSCVSALAGMILVGLAGGYLIYRRSGAALPAPGTTLGPGERLPLRVTGILRTPTGREHVREVPGELVRFVLGRPVEPAVDVQAADAGVAPIDDGAPQNVVPAAPEDVAPPEDVAAGRARPRRPDRDDAPRRAGRPAAGRGGRPRRGQSPVDRPGDGIPRSPTRAPHPRRHGPRRPVLRHARRPRSGRRGAARRDRSRPP